MEVVSLQHGLDWVDTTQTYYDFGILRFLPCLLEQLLQWFLRRLKNFLFKWHRLEEGSDLCPALLTQLRFDLFGQLQGRGCNGEPSFLIPLQEYLPNVFLEDHIFLLRKLFIPFLLYSRL